MPSTHTSNLNLEKPADGEQEGEWGTTINSNMELIDAAAATKTGAETLTNKTLTSPVLNTGASGTAIKDEDDMTSNSASHLATQQSIKAYVDSQVATEDTLAELNDTSISSPAAGHLVIYDNTASHWENATLTAGSNVSITNGDGAVTIASTDTNTQLSQEQVEDYVGGMVTGNTETGISVTYQDADGTLDFAVSDTTVAGDSGSTGITPGDTLTIAGGTNVSTAMSGDTLTIASTDTNTQLSQEQVEDFVGGMVDSNTETGIAVTYQDADGTLDFVVTDTTVAGDSGSTGITPGDTLTIAGGANTTTVMSGDTLTITGSGRNIVYNGAMQVAQRSTSETGLGAATGYFTLDRWKMAEGAASAGRYTMAQVADGPAGFANCLKITTTTADTSIAAGENLRIRQPFEGQDLQQLQKGTATAKQLTVSFYVKGNASATYTCELNDLDNGRTINQEFSVTTSWNRIELTFAADTSGPLDDDNARSLDLHIWLHAGSDFTSGTFSSNAWKDAVNDTRVSDSQTSIFDSTSRTFFITGVQMEIGTIATDFEYRTYGEELFACQRYYEKLQGSGGGGGILGTYGPSGGLSYVTWNFKNTKRAAPTMTQPGSGLDTIQNTSVDMSNGYKAAGSYAFWGWGSTADAEL